MRKQFAVLGLGSFGRSVALTLESMGCDVIVVDKSQETIQEIADRVTYAITADITEKEALSALGTRNLDGAIIGVAENLEAGIMATLLCKEIGIPMVVAKAKNKLQGTILKKVGADTVVYPEIEMGSRVAKSLLATEFTDWIELSNDYSMVEIAVPKPWINHSMAELGIRTKYGVTVVGIMQNGNVNVEIDPQMPLPENALLILVGANKVLEKTWKIGEIDYDNKYIECTDQRTGEAAEEEPLKRRERNLPGRRTKNDRRDSGRTN